MQESLVGKFARNGGRLSRVAVDPAGAYLAIRGAVSMHEHHRVLARHWVAFTKDRTLLRDHGVLGRGAPLSP